MKKNAETRNLDQNGYRQRAACICINRSKPNCTVLVSSSRNRRYYVIPGGGVELDDLTYQNAALRELEEEAGLKGHIIKPIGIFNNEDRKHLTHVFLVEVIEEMPDWLEKNCRTREWMSFEEAKKRLNLYKPYQCEYITRFENNSLIPSSQDNEEQKKS